MAVGRMRRRHASLRVGGVELLIEMDETLRANEERCALARMADHIAAGNPDGHRRLSERNSTHQAPEHLAQFERHRFRPGAAQSAAPASLLRQPRCQPEALNADWRGYHEFAHLLIPFPGNDDIWFTEGFASYYQYLLQSRAGVISQQRAWEELLEGFARGESDRSGRGRTLRSLSPDMWRERAQKRVYWTGAAFFLRVDIRLRTETGDRHSLDKTLAAFHDCCLDRHRRWNAKRLIDTLGDSACRKSGSRNTGGP